MRKPANLVHAVLCVFLLAACTVDQRTAPENNPSAYTDMYGNATPADTSTPTPDQSPTPAPTLRPPVEQLSSQGPWVLYGCLSTGLSIANVDDGGAMPFLYLPVTRTGWRWTVYPAPAGPYVVAMFEPDWSIQSTPPASGYEDLQLAIIKVPEMRVLRLIRIINEDILEELQDLLAAPLPEEGPLPLTLETIYSYVSPRFSPDGRYLLFSAALYGANYDLYLYDFEADRIRSLVRYQENEVGLGWSPDSQTILYEVPSSAAIGEYSPDGLWSIAVTGANRRKLTSEPVDSIEIHGWVSSTAFLAGTVCGVDCLQNLEIIDTKYGRITPVLTGYYENAAIDPLSKAGLLSKYEVNASAREGLYSFQVPDLTFNMLSAGEFEDIFWQPVLKQFIVTRGDAQLGTGSTNFFSSDGELTQTLAGLWLSPEDILPSPDEQYYFFKQDGLWRLYDAQGTFIRVFNAGQILWLPDSSGFLLQETTDPATHTGPIRLHLQQNNWAGEEIIPYTIQCADSFSLITQREP